MSTFGLESESLEEQSGITSSAEHALTEERDRAAVIVASCTCLCAYQPYFSTDTSIFVP